MSSFAQDETAPGKGWDGGAYHDKANMAALVLSTDSQGRLRMVRVPGCSLEAGFYDASTNSSQLVELY